MSKDIYFNNRIFTNVPADELILDYISRMHDKGLRYDTMGSYEVLNAPVDWIDGKEVTGLYELQFRVLYTITGNPKDNHTNYRRPYPSEEAEKFKKEIDEMSERNRENYSYDIVAIHASTSSGADESYRIPATQNNQFNITALQPPASSGENEEQEDDFDLVKGVVKRLAELKPYHMNPYNLGDEGEMSNLIDTLVKMFKINHPSTNKQVN